MKDFAKSIVCNTKAEAEKVGNSYQYAGSIPIEKIPDNWRPEFPKAGYIVYYAPNKAKWFATEAEAKRFAESQDKTQKAGNTKVGNAKDKNGKELKIGDIVAVKTSDPSLNHGKIVRISGDQVSVDVTGDDDIWTTPARLTVKMGNQKVGNAAKTFSGKYLDIYDNGTVVVKEGWAFGEKASVNTFERWLDYNIQAKEKVLKETKAMKEEFKKNFI